VDGVDHWSYNLYLSADTIHCGSSCWKDPSADQQLREWVSRPVLRDRLSAMDHEAAQRALEYFGWPVGDFSTR
jgi:hypothetical protein